MDLLIRILSIIGAIIIIGIIILIHEFGHYSIGRKCKIKVAEFAVGFGPKIKSWVKNDILYSIRWFFVGGFTKFYGEDEELDDKNAFNRQPVGRRALTILAGPVFNLLFAFILACVILISFGEYSPTVGDVWEGSPAQEAGVREGDIVTSMDGVDIEFYMELEAALRKANDDHTTLTVDRDGEELSFVIQKKYFEAIPEANRNGRTDEDMVVNKNMSGLSFGIAHKSYGFFEALGKTFRWMFVLFKETLIAIFLWIGAMIGVADPVYANSAGGIFSITDMISQALLSSLENVLRIGVAVSVSLAVFNLIPFPALDGGRLVFIGYEKVTGKPVPRTVEGVIHLVGFAILIVLMGVLAFKDIAKWFGG